MKITEKIILAILALLLAINFILTSSTLLLVASSYQILFACIFFMLNATKGIKWILNKETKKFIFKSFIPFVLTYVICLVLYTFYWMSFSEGASFKTEYIFRGFPNKESILLSSFYFLGLVYGYLRANKKALKIAVISVTGIIVLATVYYLNPFNNSKKIENVTILNGNYTSIQEIVNSKELRDKVVYVDLWYSSCSPCIDEFKNYLPKIKDSLESKRVTFLYVARETSHLDSKQRWMKAISKYNLKGYHYYFNKDVEQAIWEEITKNINDKKQGYPHYLIAKKGKIISFDAPKPSEQETLFNFFDNTY